MFLPWAQNGLRNWGLFYAILSIWTQTHIKIMANNKIILLPLRFRNKVQTFLYAAVNLKEFISMRFQFYVLSMYPLMNNGNKIRIWTQIKTTLDSLTFNDHFFISVDAFNIWTERKRVQDVFMNSMKLFSKRDVPNLIGHSD